MEGNEYSFIVVVKKWKRNNPTLDDLRVIKSGNTTLIAKNQKKGGIYLHKRAKIVKGRFEYIAGSNSYPILIPKTSEVHIEVTGFHSKPDINTDQYSKQDIIEVITPETNKEETR